VGADGGLRAASCAWRRRAKAGLAGDGFDAARAGGDGHLGDDLDEADFAGGGNVRAAAELAAVAADVDDADELAVFVAEEGEGALGLFVEFGLVGVDRALSMTLALTSCSTSRSCS
jgi:hypothetical protein